MSDGVIAADELRLLVERAETLLEEKKGIADDIKDVFAESKSRGFDTKAMKHVIKQRAKDRQKREEERMINETYEVALNLI